MEEYYSMMGFVDLINGIHYLIFINQPCKTVTMLEQNNQLVNAREYSALPLYSLNASHFTKSVWYVDG